jgi:hypothetical protein
MKTIIQDKLTAMLVIGCSLVAAGCAARRVHDYHFIVTGTVGAESGAPLQNVEVILQVATPIYEALTPVRSQRLVTDNGAFIFSCLSHNSTTRYTLTVRKDGFEPQTASGSGPPDGHYVFRLKKAVGSDETHQRE